MPNAGKQAHTDVLCLFKSPILSSLISGKMYPVRGHMDTLLCPDQLTVEERVNCRADKLVSEALVNAVLANQRFISSNLPFENTKLLVKGKMVTGSPKNAITQSWGSKVAQKLFHRWNIIVREADFNMVYWEGMGNVMNLLSEMFRLWVTKQVSHFNRTNCQLARIDHTRKIQNVCPNCGCRDESPNHITHCRDPGRSSVFKESVDSIVAWMKDQQTGPSLVGGIQSYLSARGTKTTVSILHLDSLLQTAAHFHNCLGWDNFAKGRICALWVEVRAQEIYS
jgi:hypothetical protein